MNQEISELEQAVALALSLSPIDKVRLVEQVMATLERDLVRREKEPKCSLYGSDVHITDDHIEQARCEMWAVGVHDGSLAHRFFVKNSSLSERENKR
jgi:hypothetical protein